MAIWLEFRCEGRAATSSCGNDAKKRCWSNDNAGPASLSYETQADVLDALREMAADAISWGWMKTKIGWFCPGCVRAERHKKAKP